MEAAYRRIKETLDILEGGFRKKSLSLFREVLKELAPIVGRMLRKRNADAETEGGSQKSEDGHGEADIDLFDNFDLPGRKRYIALFERYVQECFIQGMTLAEMEIEGKRRGIGFAVSPDPVLPSGAVSWMDRWTETFGNDYYNDVTADVVKVLKNSLGTGYSVPDVMDALGEYLTGSQYNRRRLEIIARTNATTAFNQGRMEMFRQNADFVKAVRFMAILDSRVSDICESRDGRIMLLDDPAVSENTPPLHYNCRSVLSPVDVFEWEEMQAEGKDEDDNDLKDLTDWSKVKKPQKGFGNVEKALREKAEKRSLKEVSKKSPKEVKERGDIVSIVSRQPDRNDIENTLRRIGFNEDEVRSVLVRGSIEEVENSAVTLMEKRFREKFTELPEYSHLADKWNVDMVKFADLPLRQNGAYTPEEKLIELDNRFKEDILITLGSKKNLNNEELYGLYTNLHESIHSISRRQFNRGIDEVLEETITGSLSREYLKGYLSANSFKIPGDLEFQLGNYGYSTNYNSLKTLVEPLVKNGIASDFNEYCLSLKIEQSWRSRTDMLKGSYREYIANRLNRSLIDLPQEAESLLNLFDSEGLYSTSEGVIMFMDRLKELIGA